jgi:spore coat protein YutH
MNNYINYYYTIYPNSIHEQNKTFYFIYNDEKYFFLPFNRPLEDSKFLYELNVEMIRKGLLVHEIILNKDNNALTLVNDIPYILMRVYVNEHKLINLTDIIYISMTTTNIKPNPTLDRSDWVGLWSAKIDYFEYQISQVGKKYPIICEFLSYYIGMAENAISYVKNTLSEAKKTPYDVLSIGHKRIKENYTDFDIYNPLSFIIDYPARDISEYIKAKFFSSNDVWPEIEEYFNSYDMPIYSKRLLYARLMFPSYFFDVYEAVIEGKLKEDDILPFVYKTEQYEEFLNEFHTYINRGNLIPQIDWINKKNSY